MPDTFHALLIFATFVVPGSLLQRGYSKSREHGVAESDLHALAGSVVASLFVLAVAWWCGGKTIVQWAEAGKLEDHLDAAYAFALGLLLIPYPVGFLAGAFIAWLSQAMERLREARAHLGTKWGKCFAILDFCSVFGSPTVWDGLWGRFWSRRMYIRVKTKSGQEIVGAFEHGSWVGLSPGPPQLFLSTVYREKMPGSHQWEKVPNTEGVFINGSEIESVEFAS